MNRLNWFCEGRFNRYSIITLFQKSEIMQLKNYSDFNCVSGIYKTGPFDKAKLCSMTTTNTYATCITVKNEQYYPSAE